MLKSIPWSLVIPAVVGVTLAVLIGGPLVREMVPGKIPMGDGSELGAPPGPYVHAHCLPPCRIGSHVNILSGQIEQPAWVAVYADSENAGRIWYYPSETGTMPEVPVRSNVRALSEDFQISKEHEKAGHWDLHMVLLSKPTDRAGIDALPKEAVLAHEKFELNLR